MKVLRLFLLVELVERLRFKRLREFANAMSLSDGSRMSGDAEDMAGETADGVDASVMRETRCMAWPSGGCKRCDARWIFAIGGVSGGNNWREFRLL